MRSFFALTVLAVAGRSAAQYNIDPETVVESDRRAWCLNQETQCPLICLQLEGIETMTTQENRCDWETLSYACVCDNGISPNLTQWDQTIPYYLCTEWGTQCVKNCNGDATCGHKCRADNQCGAADPYKGNATTTSGAQSATGTSPSKTSGPVPNWDAAETTPASENNNDDNNDDKDDGNFDTEGAASTMLNLGQSYGLAMVIGGFAAGFALIL